MVEYAVKAILSGLLVLLTFVLSPLLALITIRRKNFPWFLCWFGQYDDDLDGSLDPGWRKEHILTPDTGLKKWWNRVRWICRNPAQYFDYWILGIPVWDGFTVETKGDPDISDIPVFKPGFVKKTVINFDGRKVFFYRKIFKWPLVNKCCDMKLGYAIWDNVKPREKAKLVFTPLSFSKIGEPHV